MDNNPSRRSSESSDDEDMYEIAPEPPDDSEDEWFDAQITLDKQPEQILKSESTVPVVSIDKITDVTVVNKEPKKTIPLLQLKEDDTSATNLVLETNLDTMQQKYIKPQQDIMPVLGEGNLRTKIDEVCITFHVLIPSNIDFRSDTDKVFLRIWKDLRGEKILKDVEMYFLCNRQDILPAAQLTGSLVVSKANQSLQSLSYQYCIERGNSLETNEPRKSTWEMVFSDNRRTLQCITLKNSQPKDICNYYQYDGYIYEHAKKGGLIKTITGFFQGSSYTEDAVAATKTFGRDIANMLLGGKPTLDKILDAVRMSDFLRVCIERRYKITDGKIKECLWKLFTSILQNLIINDEKLGIQRKIAVCLLMLEIRYLVGFKSDDPANELICKSFLMKVGHNTRTTVEFDFLQQILRADDRTFYKDVLISLAKDICSDNVYGKNPTWMYLLPIIHFLDGICKPFQEIPPTIDHGATVPKWWGIAGELQQLSYSFKSQYMKWRIPLLRVIETLEYMFEVDIYLPRAMMACLRIEELKDAIDCNVFPIEVECSSVFYFMKFLSEHDRESLLEKCIESLHEHTFITHAAGKKVERVRLIIGLASSSDLLNISLRRRNSKLVLNAAEIFLSFLAQFDIMQSKLNEDIPSSIEIKAICLLTIGWLNDFERRKDTSMHHLLEMWDQIQQPRYLENTVHVQEWSKIMNEALRLKIQKGIQNTQRGQYERRLADAYCTGIETYSQELQDLLSPFIFVTFAEQAVNENNSVYKKLWKILSRKFLEEWNKNVKEQGRINLETLVTWSALPKYMKVLSNADITGDHFKQYQEIFSLVKTLVETFKDTLLDGTVCVEQLHMVKKGEVFLSLCEIFGFNSELIKRGLSEREDELNAFYRIRATLEAAKMFCESMEVQLDLEEVEEMLQKNVEESTLNELVVVEKLTDEPKPNNDYLQINVKSLSKEIIDMITQLEVFRKCGCFITVWKSALEDLHDETNICLNDLFERVYKPTLERLTEKAEEISSGEITHTDMESFVGKTCGTNYDMVLSELKTVCPKIPLDVCKERIKQFKECRQIGIVKAVASALLEVKKVYGLSGDFNVVERIKNYDISTLTLNSDKDIILGPSQQLSTVTREGVASLVAFAKSEELISWIREIMKGGMKELKVFVDLAMMSAGDDAEKISRVQSLHVAVNGYASLIFEINETGGLVEVLEASKTVFEELNNTPKLPEKLEYAGRYLHWFKDIKQAHSTDELTAFMQAGNINEDGVYTIGTHVWKKSDGQDTDSAVSFSEFSDIKNVLKLIVVTKGGDNKNSKYTYDKLKDLQSRLMLVAGEAEKSRDSVERFNQILEGVVRLSNIYVKLVKSGCLFFRNSSIELVCDTDLNRPVAATLYIEDQSAMLRCRKTENEKLEDIMHKIASTMESCLSSWLANVDKHRTEYPELNYFTTEQLVILQHEFSKLQENQIPSKHIYPMLHDILQNCKPDDVKTAYVKLSSTKNENDDEEQTEITNQIKEEMSKEEQFVSELIAADVCQKMVPFALKQFPDLNINDALCWCLENEDNIEKFEEAQLSQITGGDLEESLIQTENDCHSENLISRIDDTQSQFDRCENMLNKFNVIWGQFLESTENTNNRFMSLQHVGILLRHLADKGGYFLRRAFFNSNGKLHTLVNPDYMSFTLCEGIEQRLLKYQRIVQTDYRLVFICGSDSENRSVIISSLDKYRRAVFIKDHDVLWNSLRHELQINQNDTDNNVLHAASVDYDSSTVRVVKSSRSGSGKTLYTLRREEELQQLDPTNTAGIVTLPLHERKVDIHFVTSNLLLHVTEPGESYARIFHIDITNEVLSGIDYLLFNLLILGTLDDKSGYVWRKLPIDLYLIETMDKQGMEQSVEKKMDRSILNLLPCVTCRSPKECLDIYKEKYPEDYSASDQLFDIKLYETEMYQKPYECLKSIDGTTWESSGRHCIETMLRHCGVTNPSWSEIHHFVKFLSTQLQDFDKTDFVSDDIVDVLPGFPMFVKKCIIQMSRDFSSRSLNLSEESCHEVNDEDNQENDLRDYELKRTWESSPHPYLFFNSDGHTFTFLGFYINDFGDLVDLNNDEVLEKNIMRRSLMQALLQNGVPIKEDFDSLHRKDKIERLCGVIGVEKCDENMYDQTYELTTDNCKKILAVYMRFRCGIPVIIMGETGCGKTRLVTFLCELMVPRDKDTQKPVTINMIIMKVHGGVTNQDIKTKVWQAEREAVANRNEYGENVFTVLFFDEANTTESIGLIKEIMCDNAMEGKQLNICENLKFVAACNPYRRHPEEVIAKLEKAGLGYHVNAIKTKDRFGRIPMRRLVYRVQPLPQSLLPFVWDFGQLSSSVENLYIQHMVRRYMAKSGTENTAKQLPNDEQMLEVISLILTKSQEYMRNLKDECSFVSLRDVDRVLQVMCWFYSMSQGRRTLFTLSDKKLRESGHKQQLSDETRSLVLALAVCYHSSLSDRISFWQYVAGFFRIPCELFGGHKDILDEIDRVQEVFLDSVRLEESSNIARNCALKENIFMMVICIELRIPLFLVGKPGSSKSLAKVIVTDAMQGRAAETLFFKELKQVQMVSFQCSPLSSPEGIISTFHQCASFQQNYKDNLDTFVSVVVLDEIGLAEDSERMPLKTLHPLLEDGCQGDEIAEQYKKVAFIGLSNWSLDPAKMNRGVFVQRQIPDALELENTARGICASTSHVNDMIIKPLSSGYLKVFEKASEKKREFFGLRDFYSLMKMINQIVLRSEQSALPTYVKMRFAVRRNFSGLDNLDTFEIFRGKLKNFNETERNPGDPDDSFRGLLTSWLNNEYSESRHLLLLTASYSAITMFEQAFLTRTTVTPIIIFGSSFRRDQEYTQICRNINKIKICMETGKLVILVNSDNLYESLYDALNQYYVYFGGERYVDLGLGIHRVKCPVHKDFKLIVVAEKQTVYEKFPIPLINRLEKHCLTSTTLLNENQSYLARALQRWIEKVTTQSLMLRNKATEKDVAKVFIGYHHDVCATIALETWTDKMDFENLDDYKEALAKSKDILLWCVTPDAILRLTEDREEIQDIYWNKHSHESLKEYLSYQFKEQKKQKLYAQITTHSSLLTVAYKQPLREATGIHPNKILLLEALPSFDTEQQFISKINIRPELNKLLTWNLEEKYNDVDASLYPVQLLKCLPLLNFPTSLYMCSRLNPNTNVSSKHIWTGITSRMHIQDTIKDERVLIIVQCDSGDRYTNLIACAKYAILEECSKFFCKAQVSIIFIVQLTPMENKKFHNIQCGEWHSVHIDNLYTPVIEMPSISDMQKNRMSALIAESIESKQMFSSEQSDIRNLLIMKLLISLNKSPEEKPKPDKCLDLRLLIDRSLQRAMSLVRDPEKHKHRSTKRVSLILPVLHDISNKDNEGFVKGVSLLVQRIMTDRENDSPFGSPDLWLVKEASSVLAIEKFGTLRRACVEAFDTRISPILGGVFAALDTNHNLDLLANDFGTWQRNLCTQLMNTKEVNEKLLTRVHTERGLQYEVQGTGFGGYLFQCKMPFSWIMHLMFEGILRQQNVFLQDTDDQQKRFAELFEGIELIKAIDSLPKKDFYDILESYIHDFVHTVYQDENGRRLVMMSIKQMTLSRLNFENTCISTALLLVHQVYKESTSIFSYFRDICSVWCGCTDAVMAYAINFDSPENDLTILGLRALIDNITPKDKVEIGELFESERARDNWLERVHRYRQIVNQTLAYCEGELEKTDVIATERSRWNRIVVMQLCMENLGSNEEKFPVLWGLLSKCNADMKQIETLTQIERFLGICFKKTKTALKKDVKTCKKCGIVISSERLYCEKHEHANSESPRTAKKAKKGENEKNRTPLEKIREYRHRCNLVLMDIISHLCFANNTSPDSEVIEWLLSYSFKSEIDEDQQFLDSSKNEGKDIGIDSNKVFKAFLFKHLLRSNEQEFVKCLTKFINSVATDRSEPRQIDDVILSLIFSIEDNMLERINASEGHRHENAVRQQMQDALRLLKKNDSTLDQIYGIARARVALSVGAGYINMLIEGTDDNDRDKNDEIKSILLMAETLCKDKTLIWKFLLKHLSKEFGTDTLLTACKSTMPCLSWIKKDVDVTCTVDMYTACGEEYCIIKVQLLSCMIDNDGSKLRSCIQSWENKQTLAVMLELAFHREIYLHHSVKGTDKIPEENQLVEEVKAEFEGCCEKSPVLALDEDIHRKYNINVSCEDSDRDISIKCVLFHWLSVIKHMNGSCSSLLKPLFKLALKPGELKDAYLPCMPQDELADIRQQLVEDAETTFFGEQTVYYKCENGHSYEIGHCGRPYAVARCICGAVIGGRMHELEDGNEKDDGSDCTQKGHCLGLPEDRHQGALPERTLTPLQNALLKCLLHLSMYLGCGSSEDDISALIQLKTDSIHTFVWGHIIADLEDLMSGMSLNIDEVLLFIHSFIDNILRRGLDDECSNSEGGRSEQIVSSYDEETQSESETDDESEKEDQDITKYIDESDETESLETNNTAHKKEHWTTKSDRSDWEDEFAKLFLSHFIEERIDILNEAKSHLEGSSTTGILATLNENKSDDIGTESKDDCDLSDNPSVWIYRKPASIVHFKQAYHRHLELFSPGEKKITVLAMFLEQINELHALRLVPNIIELHRRLIMRYYKKIYQDEASKITIKQLKEEDVNGDITEDLIEDLKEAWNTLRYALKNYEFRVDKGRTALPLEMTDMSFTDETEVSYLLPSMEGKGICTFALLDYLFRRHNELIETYIASLSGERKQLFTYVEPRDVTAAHLINFHPEKDLLPIILENCSLSSSHIVSDEYDFGAIEKRVIDRFISTKSMVTLDQHLKIDLMVYRSEMTDASELNTLHNKIPQERLDTAVKIALCNQIHNVPSIGHILSQLDITINFLNITGGDPNESLNDYMLEKLRLKRTELTSKIQQHCLLKHVKSLWMTLSFHRCYIMVKQGKTVEVIFENISTEYHETLPEDLITECQSFAETLSKERMSQFLEILFEYIMFELTKRENKDDEDYFDKSQYRLVDCLNAFGEMNALQVDVHDVPSTILSIHSLHIWILFVQIYESRVDNNYDTEV